MSYQLRPAIKSSAKLLFGMYSESGRGKTYSALLVARGFVGPDGTIAMVETESGRGEIYVDEIPGGYLVVPIAGNFSPEEYGKAIAVAEQAKVGALIIDSASHEWESIGGVLDMAAKNQADGKKGPLVWQVPKLDHAKHFVLRLMASPIPLIIVNMRAKYPMKEVPKKGGGKEWARSEALEPKQSEDILYEMLIHGWIDEQHCFHVTKYPKAIPALRDVVKDGEPLSIETGQRLAQWAAGGQSKASAAGVGQPPEPSDQRDGGRPSAEARYITPHEVTELEQHCASNGIPVANLLKAAGVQRLAQIETKNLARATAWINAAITVRKQAPQPT